MTAQLKEIVAEAPVEELGEVQQTVVDVEAEARHHGWTPKEDFKGDPDKWVDAETFVKRADEVMPFLKKQNTALKREIDDMKREFKKAQKHFSAAEDRAYQRALTDLESRHEEAVEAGDIAASKRIRQEMSELKPAEAEPASDVDVAAFQKRLGEWIQESDWYLADETKTKYADIQSDMIIREHGALHEYPGGLEEALKEIERRVDRKFAQKKPSPTNGAGNREAKGKGARTLNDLPPEARAQAVKWDKSGIVKIDDYLKTYDWN